MADSTKKVEKIAMNEVSDDDDEVALVTSMKDREQAEVDSETEQESDVQINGAMVLALLDKIIGVVDEIQQTQSGLEARQRRMERSVTGIQGELAKLSKKHTATTDTVNKMLDKVRKVNVNVKTVRSNLESQAGQIKRLENNEKELLKRRNFKVLIYQEEAKTPPKVVVSKSKKGKERPEEGGEAEEELEPEEGGEGTHNGLSSSEEVEIEEIIEESRAQRIKHSGLQRMSNIKKVFSKEKMEKTRQRTQENLKKTRQRTQENIEKTKHRLEKKMGKLSKRMSVRPERKEKLKSSREKIKKSFNPDHTVYARSKTTIYRVPPFTFHVKKIREGEVEVQGFEVEQEAGEGEIENEEEEGHGMDELQREGSQELPPLLQVEEDSSLVVVKDDRQRETD